MVSPDGVGYGLAVMVAGAGVVRFAHLISVLTGVLPFVQAEGDARTATGMRTLLLKGTGVFLAGVGVVVTLLSLAN
ncbi:hypothetical protein [Halorubellus sp. PRR65]|uniref:hypothetical protein n=1 Tax=Halorubellus sp. PRR65 TaxID=3098148 RepID=UPI002B262FF8|nr:hypothetical protein [Halorubellus sp. PRR65]